jgi:hypothetical protein
MDIPYPVEVNSRKTALLLPRRLGKWCALNLREVTRNNTHCSCFSVNLLPMGFVMRHRNILYRYNYVREFVTWHWFSQHMDRYGRRSWEALYGITCWTELFSARLPTQHMMGLIGRFWSDGSDVPGSRTRRTLSVASVVCPYLDVFIYSLRLH